LSLIPLKELLELGIRQGLNAFNGDGFNLISVLGAPFDEPLVSAPEIRCHVN
jgi:hypothetical protein